MHNAKQAGKTILKRMIYLHSEGEGKESLNRFRVWIHKSTISFSFPGKILRFLRLKASSFVFSFLQNEQTVSCLHWLFLYGFLGGVSVRFSSYRCNSNLCFYEEKMYLHINEGYKKKMLLSKVNKESNVNKAKPPPPPSSRCCCRNLKSK